MGIETLVHGESLLPSVCGARLQRAPALYDQLSPFPAEEIPHAFAALTQHSSGRGEDTSDSHPRRCIFLT
jgi:hypothetical protein